MPQTEICILGILCLLVFGTSGYIFDKTKFISKQNIANGSNILIGYSDKLHHFFRLCQNSEIMEFFEDGGQHYINELALLNKTFPTFAFFYNFHKFTIDIGHPIQDTFRNYLVVISAKGHMLKYSSAYLYIEFNKWGQSNRLTYEGSNTFFDPKAKNWVSFGKSNKVYRTSSETSMKFEASTGNYQQLVENAKKIELFPLNEKWILLMLKGCGAISYYVGDVSQSKFDKLSGPHEFMQAENINDFSVCIHSDPSKGFFNTYLRKSAVDCRANNWNAVIPVFKVITLTSVGGTYHIQTTFPEYFPELSIQFASNRISTNSLSVENRVNNFYITVYFRLSPNTTEIGLVVRNNLKTNVGVTVGLNVQKKYYYFHKGGDYKVSAEQDYCECGCPVSKNVTATFKIPELPELKVFADGPVIETNYYDKFVQTLFAFRDHEDNGILIFSKGYAEAEYKLHNLD